MKKYIVMGNYTAKAFQGFMKDPHKIEQLQSKQLTEAVGGNLNLLIYVEVLMISLEYFRGCAFEDFAAIKLAVESTGTVKNVTILEEMDINKAAELAAKAMAGYKPAG